MMHTCNFCDIHHVLLSSQECNTMKEVRQKPDAEKEKGEKAKNSYLNVLTMNDSDGINWKREAERIKRELENMDKELDRLKRESKKNDQEIKKLKSESETGDAEILKLKKQIEEKDNSNNKRKRGKEKSNMENNTETKEDKKKRTRFDMSKIKWYWSESDVPAEESEDDLDIYSDSEDESINRDCN